MILMKHCSEALISSNFYACVTYKFQSTVISSKRGYLEMHSTLSDNAKRTTYGETIKVFPVCNLTSIKYLIFYLQKLRHSW